jgi:hypothetical protein
MKNSCGSFKHMRAEDGKQNLQFHWHYGILEQSQRMREPRCSTCMYNALIQPCTLPTALKYGMCLAKHSQFIQKLGKGAARIITV